MVNGLPPFKALCAHFESGSRALMPIINFRNLTEMFVRLSDSSKRELRNTKTDLAVPRHKSTFGRFSYKGAKLWNDLSIEVKSFKTYEIFKKNVSATTPTVNANFLSPAMFSSIFNLFIKKFCK